MPEGRHALGRTSSANCPGLGAPVASTRPSTERTAPIRVRNGNPPSCRDGPVRVRAGAGGHLRRRPGRVGDGPRKRRAARLLSTASDPRSGALADRGDAGREAPVGLALVRGGTRIVVADSNRFNVPGSRASLAVVDVAAALAGRLAVLGYLPAGEFPRQMALEPGAGSCS
jgi:hypothetical protein